MARLGAGQARRCWPDFSRHPARPALRRVRAPRSALGSALSILPCIAARLHGRLHLLHLRGRRALRQIGRGHCVPAHLSSLGHHGGRASCGHSRRPTRRRCRLQRPSCATPSPGRALPGLECGDRRSGPSPSPSSASDAGTAACAACSARYAELAAAAHLCPRRCRSH